MIADYKGSLGYNTGYTDYAKFGYYNWTASAMGSTPRKVLLREPTIVNDPTGQKYSPEQLRAHVGSSATSSASPRRPPSAHQRHHQHERRRVLHGPLRSHPVTEDT